MNEEVINISLNAVDVVSNTRTTFDEHGLKELAQSIRENGVIQPIIVTPLGEDRYRLICGERRWRASFLAGQSDIPAFVRSIPDEKILQVQIIENLQRRNVAPMDEIRAICRLRDEEGMTPGEIARSLGKAPTIISKCFQLGRAHPTLHEALEEEQLTLAVATAIAKLETHEQQAFAVQSLRRARRDHRVTLKAAEQWIAKNFGAQPQGQRGFRPAAPVESTRTKRFADDWKYYLVRFSDEQFAKWRDIVRNRTDFIVWAEAVEVVMAEQVGATRKAA